MSRAAVGTLMAFVLTEGLCMLIHTQMSDTYMRACLREQRHMYVGMYVVCWLSTERVWMCSSQATCQCQAVNTQSAVNAIMSTSLHLTRYSQTV